MRIWYNLRPEPGRAAFRWRAGSLPSIVGILAQEIYRGESLLFLREAPELRQRAQPLFARHSPALEPEPAEDTDPGRQVHQARLRLYLLPEGFQGSKGFAFLASRLIRLLHTPGDDEKPDAPHKHEG